MAYDKTTNLLFFVALGLLLLFGGSSCVTAPPYLGCEFRPAVRSGPCMCQPVPCTCSGALDSGCYGYHETFWRPWCMPCGAMQPDMVEMQTEIQIIGENDASGGDASAERSAMPEEPPVAPKPDDLEVLPIPEPDEDWPPAEDTPPAEDGAAMPGEADAASADGLEPDSDWEPIVPHANSEVGEAEVSSSAFLDEEPASPAKGIAAPRQR
ncbi:MAG: hypothetical protein JXB62_00900 [Pirellulales bacterium]|nr:hypothetical protein [Pirellulales bacterium]